LATTVFIIVIIVVGVVIIGGVGGVLSQVVTNEVAFLRIGLTAHELGRGYFPEKYHFPIQENMIQ